MTREEAKQFLDNMKHAEAGRAIGKDDFFAELMSYHVQALSMAISALEQNESAEEWYKLFVEKLDEQEPCKDAISREYLFKVLDDFCGHDRTATITLDTLADLVYDMPSVTPSRQVIEDIKADIEAARYGLINDGLDVALRIIDKHIEGR